MHSTSSQYAPRAALTRELSGAPQGKVKQNYVAKRVFLDLVREASFGGASPGPRSPACAAAQDVRVRCLEISLQASKEEVRLRPENNRVFCWGWQCRQRAGHS